MHIEVNQTHKNLVSIEVEQREITTLALSERKELHKVAVIGHSKLIQTGVALDDVTMPWHEKYFDIKNLDEAWQWVHINIINTITLNLTNQN